MHDKLKVARTILGAGSGISFRAIGNSMTPFIRDSETVIVEPIPSSLQIGDVILYEDTQGKLRLHRIVKKTEQTYITRGDAACHHDEIIHRSEILGRAVHVVDGLSFHLRFPVNAFVAVTLGLRKHPLIFSMLSRPGSLLLRSLRTLCISRGSQAKSD